MVAPPEIHSSATQTFEETVLDDTSLPIITLTPDQLARRDALSPTTQRANRALVSLMLAMSHDPDAWHVV